VREGGKTEKKSDIENVLCHLNRSSKWVQCGTSNLLPIDRNLLDGHVQLLGKEEQLYIKCPSLNVKVREEELSALSGKKLESALSVPHIGHTKHHQHVETSLKKFPQEGSLCNSVFLLQVVAGPHGDAQSISLGLLKALLEPIEVCKLGGAISVNHQHVLSPGNEHAPSDGASLASVLGELEDTYLVKLVLSGIAQRYLGGPIARAVVHDHYLVGEARIFAAPLLQVGARFVQHGGHTLFFVVGRHDERQVDLRRNRGGREGLLLVRSRIQVHVLILVPQDAALRQVAQEERSSHNQREQEEGN